MTTNLFMMFILLCTMLLLGPYSYATTKEATKKVSSAKKRSKQPMSPGAQRAQEYFKHDDDYTLTMKVVDPPKAKASAVKHKKRKLASQPKSAKLSKKKIALNKNKTVLHKNKMALHKNKKNSGKLRRQVASKGVPLKLPPKKIISASETKE